MAIQDTSRPEAPSTTGPRSVTRRDILKGMAVVAGAAALAYDPRRLQLHRDDRARWRRWRRCRDRHRDGRQQPLRPG